MCSSRDKCLGRERSHLKFRPALHEPAILGASGGYRRRAPASREFASSRISSCRRFQNARSVTSNQRKIQPLLKRFSGCKCTTSNYGSFYCAEVSLHRALALGRAGLTRDHVRPGSTQLRGWLRCVRRCVRADRRDGRDTRSDGEALRGREGLSKIVLAKIQDR